MIPRYIPPYVAPATPPVTIVAPSYAKKPIAVADTECYPNWWSIGFMTADRKTLFDFEQFQGITLDRQGLMDALLRYTIITFNGIVYDIPMITLALAGATCEQLKVANDLIIVGRMKPWDFYTHFRLEKPVAIDHIDLAEMCPGVKVSLKTYGGRIHSKVLWDLPINPAKAITNDERLHLIDYRGNDLRTTLDLHDKTVDRLKLRAAINAEFGDGDPYFDVRSKSDAQAAEAVFKKRMGERIEIPVWPHGTKFKYVAPPFIRFNTPTLQAVLEKVQRVDFITSDKDQVDSEIDEDGIKIKTGVLMPPELKGVQAKVKVGNTTYTMGIGGLHSTEKHVTHVAIPGVQTLQDVDATSFYPFIMLLLGLYPHQMGPKFLEILRYLIDARVYAKRMAQSLTEEADKLALLVGGESEWFDIHAKIAELRAQAEVWQTKADGYKIMINGIFGKTGSKWSIVFAPNMLIQTTITGQLLLLMLIEDLEQAGISVVSANTDGIVIKCPIALHWLRDQIIRDFELRTGFKMEANDYRMLASQACNSYIAITADNKPKTKGMFAKPTLQVSGANQICTKAVIDYLLNGTMPADTIATCTDIRPFITIKTVKGGAFKGGALLGKSVRWYYGKGEMGALVNGDGNQVQRSQGAIPMMQMLDTLPDDLDRDWYVREAYSMLGELGLTV